MARQAQDAPNQPLDPFNLGDTFMELFTRIVSDPVTMWEKQMDLWQDYLQLLQATTHKMLGEQEKPVISPDPKDRRFRDEAWQDNTVFDFIKQSYLLTARWMQHTAHDASKTMTPQMAKKLEFYTRQFVDAMSPSNFLITNPEVLKATLESKGENLAKGLENMLEDLERGKGKLRINMTDLSAFKIGKNLAVTSGKVVFQNDLMQLIQYEPTTKTVSQIPLLVVPAWINKFYILDLQPENSAVKWLLDQGHTVFMISWVNPDENLNKKTFEDYMAEGPLAAMDVIEEITGEHEVNIAGYCLGGTLVATTLAWLTARQEQKRVKSVTYLTTMVDFTEAGELSVFIDEEQLAALETRMTQMGFLDGGEMATTFSMLRANDLIWSFVVNNYLLGKDPFPFDLLYWNADSTRMPAAMHSYYLRNMYQKNLLAKGSLKLRGEIIDLKQIDVPTFILSCREDHIAPWKSTYAATQLYKGPVEFVLAASGHIAGVVNPPAKKKYSHWVWQKKSPLPAKPEEWFKAASEHPGSWWPHWQAWQEQFTGKRIPARKVGSAKHKPLEDAPGSYVKVMG